MAQQRSAMDMALRYLAPRMRTEQELRRHLADRDYAAAEIETVCRELREQRYLDDAAYAEAYVRYALEKHRGSRRIRRELRERGINAELAGNACEDVLYELGIDESSEALAIALYAVYGSWPETRDPERLRLGEAALPEHPERGATDDAGEPLENRRLAAVARKLDNLGYGSSTITCTLEIMRGWRQPGNDEASGLG